MNHILVAGHLGGDPETRFTSGGQKVTTFRIASNTRRGGKEETTWYKITVWGEQFDKMMPYIKKGSPIMVAGELSSELYQNREGQTALSLNVTASNLMFSPFGRGSQEGGQQGQQQAAPQQQQQYGGQAQQAPAQPAMATPASPFDSMMQGGGSASLPFSDEEIPF
ncbi:MAG: single-stranded DNA-binding protein [Simkaniaceae bacterium]|nr:single-stranded DNA-binding protein [Simkaniaceae bacterium]